MNSKNSGKSTGSFDLENFFDDLSKKLSEPVDLTPGNDRTIAVSTEEAAKIIASLKKELIAMESRSMGIGIKELGIEELGIEELGIDSSKKSS